jgi:hypothetical protein
MEQFQALGAHAQELSAAAKEVAARPDASHASGGRAALGALREQIEALAAAAAQVARDAGAKEFEDVSRDAESLRQSLLSMRNRLGLLAQA